MANKWMIAAVTAALFSGADWFGATHSGTTQIAAPALSVPAAQATQQPLAVSGNSDAENTEASRKSHS